TFKKGLEDNGFEVDSFNDPQIALSNFTAGTYDIALIDIKMPKINGFDLYRKLRNTDYKVKYCFMTAYEVYYETLKKDYPTLNVGCFQETNRYNRFSKRNQIRTRIIITRTAN
ncbi:MAG: response regulator, partial [Candidatus Nitrosopolaris sp.]